MANLNIISFNVKGINDVEKRLSIFSWCKEKMADICLLQETHSSIKDKKNWCKDWGGIFTSLMAVQGHGV